MEIIFVGLIFIFGLIFGSFFNVLIFRLNSEEKWVPKFWEGRSVCPKCKKQIAWFDNIPLLSFLLLNGRCRNCKKLISWQYPIVELTTGVITAVIGWFFMSHSPILEIALPLLSLSLFWQTIFYLLIAYVSIIIFFSDLIYGLIPDEAVLFGIGVTVVFETWQGLVKENLLVGATAALFFFIVVLVTKFRGMGFGDVKLAFLIGLVLGWPAAVVGFWISFVLGGVFALLLLALKRVRFSATIALGPFLVTGAVISALWSTKLLQSLGL
jgi:prepilin signal peptidase PulO-like enzyme (type II secretory pathway)